MVASYACAAHQHFPPTGPHESALTEMTDARAGESYSVSVLVDLRAVIFYGSCKVSKRTVGDGFIGGALVRQTGVRRFLVCRTCTGRYCRRFVGTSTKHRYFRPSQPHISVCFLHSVTVSDAQHNSKNTGTRSNSPSPGRDGGHHFASFWYLSCATRRLSIRLLVVCEDTCGVVLKNASFRTLHNYTLASFACFSTHLSSGSDCDVKRLFGVAGTFRGPSNV